MRKRNEIKRAEGIRLNGKTAARIGAIVLAGALTVGGSIAYLTDTGRTTNKFTVGKVEVQLDEPNWKEPDNQKLEAGQTFAKDPTVTNTGVNDAYVYLEVQVPMADVITANADGTRAASGAAVHQELFTFASNPGWTQISKKEVSNHMVYTYSYDEIMSAGQKTRPLFNTMTFANVVEGQIDLNKYEVPVHAFAIQTIGTSEATGNVQVDAKAAYAKYANQNLGQSGAVVR